MALAEQKARTFRRAVVNKAKNFTPIETKVREATSNDPWGPETTLLHEIADASHNVVAFGEIMNVLWKRINDDGKNWRHVMKSLTVLECLVKTGAEKCAEQCKKNIYAIETLSTFQHIDKDGKDMGHVVREKAKNLVILLKDEERLKSERQKALKLREKMSSTTVWSLSSTGQRNMTSGTSWRPTYPTETSDRPQYTSNTASSGGSNSANIAPEMQNALPSDATEEELQLQLALALSKEEAEKEESQRKNADIRLQMALEESKKEEKRKESIPNSDLLSLNLNAPAQSAQPTLKEQAQKALSNSGKQQQPPASAFDPWGHSNNSAPDPFGGPSNDPFGGLTTTADNQNGVYPSLFAANSGNNMPAPLMPMSTDAGKSETNISKPEDDMLVFERPASPTAQVAESFLGDHAKLVDFNSLITPTRPTPGTDIFPTANPFTGGVPARGNPFQPPKAPQPSINELRNQQAQNSLSNGSAAGMNSGAMNGFGGAQPFFPPPLSQPMSQPPPVPAFPIEFMDNASTMQPQPAQTTNNDFNPFR